MQLNEKKMEIFIFFVFNAETTLEVLFLLLHALPVPKINPNSSIMCKSTSVFMFAIKRVRILGKQYSF